MKNDMSFSNSALRAMHRAAQIARDRAAEKRIKIPIWRNGKIYYEIPKQNTDQIYPADS